MDETHPARDPAHRPRKLHRIAPERIARRGQARSLLGVGHHLFDLVQLPRKPGGQTLRQQAERGMALRTVPASDLRPARALARVGAVACQRTAPVRVVRAALNPCIAPRPGPNVCLAGKPRVVAKLHRPWPGGVGLPRGPTPLWCEGAPRLRARPCHAKRQGAGRVLRTGRDRASPKPFPNARPAIPNHPRGRPSTPGSGKAPIATSHGPHDTAAAPALLPHPRKSVYGTARSNQRGIPRAKPGNNKWDWDRIEFVREISGERLATLARRDGYTLVETVSGEIRAMSAFPVVGCPLECEARPWCHFPECRN